LSRLLILGGSPFQVPAIVHAARRGHHVITCDFLPHNPGHRYADESYNVSTTDCHAVLELARELQVDGVLAFASDPAASTAAYVASALNLPGCGVQAAHCLSNKAAFRAFLSTHGFRTPRFAVAATKEEAQEAATDIGFPLMMKPTDSSGSKGVSLVEHSADLDAAFLLAREYGRNPYVILEQFIARQGPQIAGDGLVVEGCLVFGCFGDEHFDLECCPHAPVGESFPGHLSETTRAQIFRQLQRLFTLLGVRNLVFNLDAMLDTDGELVLIEVGPRAGGNCLPTVIREHTGVDLVDIAIRQALGIPVPAAAYAGKPGGFHASWMIHSRSDGILDGLRVASEVAPYVRELELTASHGSAVQRFKSARDTLGYAVLSFPSARAMSELLAQMARTICPVLA
jgi:biotin carboxylase